MTSEELAAAIEQYHAGIEAELRLLRQLESVATQQRDVTGSRDFGSFRSASDTRDELTQSLVAIEEDMQPLRQKISEARAEAENVPGFDRVLALHREASDLVGRILSIDRDSFRALADAEQARRTALSQLDHGETTLAAYRKVLAPQPPGAHLVDQRG